jgi:hypothetical protein
MIPKRRSTDLNRGACAGTVEPYHHRIQTGDMMAKNILPWLPRLTEKERHEIEACGLHPYLSTRHYAIETMDALDSYCASSMCAGGLGRSIYVIIADKLRGPQYTSPEDQPD